MEIFRSAADVHAALDREMGPGEWTAIEQSRVDGFADDTEDHQWIHVDPERAAETPFGGTIAHGFLTLSLVPYLLTSVRRLENVTMGVNYGLNTVRFPAPVRVGAKVRARATITDVTDLSDGGVQTTTTVTVEIQDEPKPGCVAEYLTRVYFAS